MAFIDDIRKITNNSTEKQFSEIYTKEELHNKIKEAAANGDTSIHISTIGVRDGVMPYDKNLIALLDSWLGEGFIYTHDVVLGLTISW